MAERVMPGMAVMVKAQGVSEAWYNGQRDRVVEAIRAKAEGEKAALLAEMEQMEIDHRVELEIERDRADRNARGRFDMLAEKLDALHWFVCSRRGPVKRALRKIENAWAFVWAVTFGGVWVDIGQTLGLWERIEDDEDQH